MSKAYRCDDCGDMRSSDPAEGVTISSRVKATLTFLVGDVRIPRCDKRQAELCPPCLAKRLREAADIVERNDPLAKHRLQGSEVFP